MVVCRWCGQKGLVARLFGTLRPLIEICVLSLSKDLLAE